MVNIGTRNILKWISLAVTVLAMTCSQPAVAQQSVASTPAILPASPASKIALPTASGYHEDLSSLSLEKSTFHPEPPVIGQRDDVSKFKFTRERLQLQWRPSDPLDLYVMRPTGVEKPPVILYLYSFPQDTDRFKDDVWGASATGPGYAAVGFVSAFTGHRAEHGSLKEWFVSQFQESLVDSAHDVQMILNYLATRGDLDMNRVAIFGQGSGGSIAILAAAADSRIKAVDVLTPWGDWPNWIANSKVVPDAERSKYLTPEFLASVADFDPVILLPKLKVQHLRVQNVRKDPTVPDEVQEHIEAAAPRTAKINQYGDGAALVPEAAGGKIFDWIKAQLAPEEKSRAAADSTQRIQFFPAKGKPPIH